MEDRLDWYRLSNAARILSYPWRASKAITSSYATKLDLESNSSIAGSMIVTFFFPELAFKLVHMNSILFPSVSVPLAKRAVS